MPANRMQLTFLGTGFEGRNLYLLAALITGIALFCIIISNSFIEMNFTQTAPSITISTPVLTSDNYLPSIYTCQGQGINPPLKIGNVPTQTHSLALIMDDPDAPIGIFTHWLMWNLNPKTFEIKENSVPPGAIQGSGTSGKASFVPPCPPSGTHHYIFTVYALDAILNLPAGSNRQALEQAMEGHILTFGQLITLYAKH